MVGSTELEPEPGVFPAPAPSLETDSLPHIQCCGVGSALFELEPENTWLRLQLSRTNHVFCKLKVMKHFFIILTF